MNAGTRTLRGVIAPFLPVNSASVWAASSSPAPPAPLSPVPVPLPSLGSVSVAGPGSAVSVCRVSDGAVVSSETVPVLGGGRSRLVVAAATAQHEQEDSENAQFAQRTNRHNHGNG